MKITTCIKSMPNNISEYSLTAENILGKKRPGITLAQISGSKHIWNPNDPRSSGASGGQPSGAKEIQTECPTQQKEPHCAAVKSSGPFFPLITYKLLNQRVSKRNLRAWGLHNRLRSKTTTAWQIKNRDVMGKQISFFKGHQLILLPLSNLSEISF